MKKIVTLLALWALTNGKLFAGDYSSLWQNIDAAKVPTRGTQVLHPDHFQVFYTNNGSLQTQLKAISKDPANAQLIDLPMPDGSYRSFKVWQTPVMEKGLSDRYPGIYTFTAEATDNRKVTAKIDYTLSGFHAMIFDGANTAFVDPYSKENDGYYLSYYKRDYSRPAGKAMACDISSEKIAGQEETPVTLNKTGLPDLTALNRTYGTQKRNYRLALACTGEYAFAVAGLTPTKAAVLSHMVTSINRVNGVYERELAITMTLIANTDTLIYLDATTDPYTNNDGNAMLSQNQATVTASIGGANYDIGHVFSTGGGGVAIISSVCSNSSKAMGVTGSGSPMGDAFDIDYVAHEMGHQYGADHTFNANTVSCNANANSDDAYEPGSGSTIMAYAGICGVSDNLQPHSDAYFHAKSLLEITTNITRTSIANCPTVTTSGNTPNTMAAINAVYNIPFKTPFELTALPATDNTADSLTYCWEEWDLGDFEKSFNVTRMYGPIFRSFSPDTSKIRIFPALPKLLNNITSYIGEKLPDTSRKLCFKLTTRDMYQGTGCFNFSEDSVRLNVIYTTTGFSVTSPSSASINWTGGSTQTVTWNVAQTNASPISCDSVTIYMSEDGGHTFPFNVKTVLNTGSATITVPNMNTVTTARVKVKGKGNVFFNINTTNFSVTHNNSLPWPTAISNVVANDEVKIYPVPATEILHVSVPAGNTLQASVLNNIGQVIWRGSFSQSLDIPVSGWAKGVYFLRMTDAANGQQNIRRFVVQ